MSELERHWEHAKRADAEDVTIFEHIEYLTDMWCEHPRLRAMLPHPMPMHMLVHDGQIYIMHTN